MNNRKIDHFNLPEDELDYINESLASRGVMANDVISITYNSKKDLYQVWFKV